MESWTSYTNLHRFILKHMPQQSTENNTTAETNICAGDSTTDGKREENSSSTNQTNRDSSPPADSIKSHSTVHGDTSRQDGVDAEKPASAEQAPERTNESSDNITLFDNATAAPITTSTSSTTTEIEPDGKDPNKGNDNDVNTPSQRDNSEKGLQCSNNTNDDDELSRTNDSQSTTKYMTKPTALT